jgi:flagellar biosynthesis protein FliR
MSQTKWLENEVIQLKQSSKETTINITQLIEVQKNNTKVLDDLINSKKTIESDVTQIKSTLTAYDAKREGMMTALKFGIPIIGFLLFMAFVLGLLANDPHIIKAIWGK